MSFKSLLTAGPLTGILTFIATVVSLFNMDTLASFLRDPQTAQTVVTVVAGIMSIVSGVLAGIQRKPAVSE
jgi:threonine/homoserine/homoserine lactone efflux protein